MRKKAILTLFLAVVLLLPVWAGGKQEQEGAGEAEGGEAEEVSLSVLWFNDANESEVFKNTVQDYLDAHPNVSIDLQLIPFEEYEKRLKLMIAGGEPPDLARVTNNHIAMFVDQLQPLNGKVDNLDQVLSGFNDASIAFATHPSGDVIALPTEATANGMVVNVDYYENAGIDVRELSKDWTWEEWYDAMNKVIAENENLDYALGYDFSPHRWSTLLYEAGGRFLNEDETAMNFGTPEDLDALKFFKRLHDDGLVPPSIWMGSENPQEMFKAGLVASHIGGSWVINAYARDVEDFEWAAVRMPKRKIRSSVAGGKFIGTFKGAKHQEAAIDLMLHFSDKEHNAMYCKNTFNLSARTDTNIQYSSRTKDFQAMAADLAVTPAITAEDWKSPELNKIYSYIREQIVEMLLGNQPAEETAENIHERGNTFF